MVRILIIEDDANLREELVDALRFQNFIACEAANGEIGVELARAQPPDLIICDVMMPKLDGFGVLRQLQADPTTANIPFIFLTARGERADIRRGMNLGADDYLTKPFTRVELLYSIHMRLEKHARAEQARREAFLQQLAWVQQGNRQLETDMPPMPTEAEFMSGAQSSQGYELLTDREREVMQLTAEGKTSAEISNLLFISPRTAETHRANLMRKLGLHTRAELIRYALKRGFITLLL